MPGLLHGDLRMACASVLDRVDGAWLDCVADDLALVLAYHGVADVRTPFAQDWRFDLVGSADGLPGVDLPPADQDDLLAARTGWRPVWQPIGRAGDALPAWQQAVAAWQLALAAGDPVVLVGDAYHLAWLPYHGHEHMDHGFVLAGLDPDEPGPGLVASVVDPYRNVTQWGRAEPLVTTVALTDLAPALTGGRWAVLTPVTPAEPPRPAGGPSQAADPGTVLRANAGAILAAQRSGGYRSFVDAHAQPGPAVAAHLALQTWLLARNRGLHARWLADQAPDRLDPGLAEAFAERVAAGWQRASELAYLALRRVQSGRTAPPAAIDAVRRLADEEIELARTMLTVLGGLPCC